MKSNIPRGIRNNNPLNIRIGNNWIGEVEHPTDPSFEQFKKLEYGCRAGFIILRNYIVRHKCNTVRKIIARWAPSNENNTKAYIDTVCQRTGFSPDEKLDYTAPMMMKLFSAMAWVECGCEIELEAMIRGWVMAPHHNRT